MKERTVLQSDSQLCLTCQDGPAAFSRVFRIHSPLASGGFCQCYRASHSASGIGILREFYPLHSSWRRLEDGHLVFAARNDGEEAWLRTEKADYLKPYELLLQVKKKNPELNTLIPYFEIYQSAPQETFYIFSFENECVPFSEVCLENTGREPVEFLQIVLSCLLSLAQGLKLLHSMDLYHNDIHPENFGFQKRGDQLLTQKITLFDVNSLTAGETEPVQFVTPGYSDPAATPGQSGCLRDLYAFGRTLCYALAQRKPGSSEDLLPVQEATALLHTLFPSYPILTDPLETILRRTCGYPRYDSVAELEEDLERVLQILHRLDPAQQQDTQSLKQFRDALWLYQYRHPLTGFWDRSHPDFRILVLGDGLAASALVDLALQHGQSMALLDVSVFGLNSPQRYLQERLALAVSVPPSADRILGSKSSGFSNSGPWRRAGSQCAGRSGFAAWAVDGTPGCFCFRTELAAALPSGTAGSG